MQGSPADTAQWPSPAYRQRHFQRHRGRLNVQTVDEYDASARETIRQGVRYVYTDHDSRSDRVGYFWRGRRKFTALSDDEALILSHFRTGASYVRQLDDVIESPP